VSVIIIVPAFNESENIKRVVNDIKKENANWDILVVNDCSLDNTSAIAKLTKQAFVLDLPFNLGIGGAVQAGFKYAKTHNYDIAIKYDGNGQHLPDEIKTLLNVLSENNADVVIGSRFLEKHDGFKSTLMRRVGIKIFQILNSMLIKQKITDNTSGFIAFNKQVISFFAEHYPTDYPEPESIINLKKNGFVIKEVFVKMQHRQGGKSSISGLKSVYYMLKVILAIIMGSMRKKILRD
jgi:glycosyltransferase involved in cell wall biosynthesis